MSGGSRRPSRPGSTSSDSGGGQGWLKRAREGVAAHANEVGVRDLAAAADTKLRAKRVAVGLDRPGRDPEPYCDLLVRAAGGDQREDLCLSGRDRCMRGRSVQLHVATLKTEPEQG